MIQGLSRHEQRRDDQAYEDELKIRAQGLAAERDVALAARHSGDVASEVADEVLAEIESRALRDT